MSKKFFIPQEQIVSFVVDAGGCFATDTIMVEGQQVGYMYREAPGYPGDSGWRFMTGEESEEYMNTPENMGIYDINTLINYDPDIISFLNEPQGSAFERNRITGQFSKIEE